MIKSKNWFYLSSGSVAINLRNNPKDSPEWRLGLAQRLIAQSNVLDYNGLRGRGPEGVLASLVDPGILKELEKLDLPRSATSTLASDAMRARRRDA